MIDILDKAVSFFTAPVATLVGGYNERKTIAAQSAREIAQAETELKVTKIKAEQTRIQKEADSDVDYDMQVLRNRNKTLMDELLIIVFVGLFLAHFVPSLQPYMAGGWVAMGYEGAPWWFEFAIVGILISTLGLFRLFKFFIGRFYRVRPAQ